MREYHTPRQRFCCQMAKISHFYPQIALKNVASYESTKNIIQYTILQHLNRCSSIMRAIIEVWERYRSHVKGRHLIYVLGVTGKFALQL